MPSASFCIAHSLHSSLITVPDLMATSLRYTPFLLAIPIIASLCFSSGTTIHSPEQSITPSAPLTPPPTPTPTPSPTPTPTPTPTPSPTPSPTPTPPQEPQDQSFFSHTSLLPPILSHLGFNELATAAPSLSDSTASMAWPGPYTLFAPSDSSLRSCISCSIPNLLREHIVPGLFTVDYLRKLAFGTRIETLSPGRCITITSERSKNGSVSSAAKVFIGGVEVTQPDLFNNGLVVVHGLQGFVSPLSPFSCDVERMTSLSFPFHPERTVTHQIYSTTQSAVMRLMLRDTMLRLRNNGFNILALAMKVKYGELIGLNNMTVFAVDDVSIFSGSHAYISNIRFHIVPNHYLTFSDLEKLPTEITLPTLERGQSLSITTAGGGLSGAPVRINYVRIRVPDVIRNLKIAVHSVFLPFPHIHPTVAPFDQMLGGGEANGAEQVDSDRTVNGICDDLEGNVGFSEAPMAQVNPSVDVEDHHGL